MATTAYQSSLLPGENYGQWAARIGLGQNEVQPTSSNPLDIWESFRQNSVNSFNTSLANRPDLQSAGVQQMTFTPGNYSGMEEALTNKYGSHLATDAAGNTTQLAYRPLGLGGSGASSLPPPTTSAASQPSAWQSSVPMPAMPSAPAQGAMGSGYGLGSNPFQGAQADAIRQQSQDLFGQLNNQITSSAVGVGGLGGSRQGVAQGVAQGQAQNYLQGNLANLYGGNWNADQGRALSQYQGDQNFYTAQRGQDQSGAALGASLYNQGTMGQWGPINAAGGVYSPYTGNGNTTVNTSGGGGWQGALGGALGTAQLGKNFGWWG